MEYPHVPVMLEEVIASLAPASGRLYVDGNLGLGGHAERILELSGPDGQLIGFDLDAGAMALARERLARFGGRARFVHGNFASMKEALMELGVNQIDGLLLDLGLSSLQLDASGRGFSFRGREPLDMRMDQRQPVTAAELVNTASQEELADIFFYYGEERQARRIAAWIVEARRTERIEFTDQLVRLVEQAVPRRFHPDRIHVATKVFQALRIAVNGELESLSRVLADLPDLLRVGGRVCVISFHSLEDRLVKRVFRQDRRLDPLGSKPLLPGRDECLRNPRARSAKLRVATRRDD
ncbi:MAG: 16S rRNA (cytosine(1402)-N(4))-methyltransferase RsmH [Thermodesulfobacteriota bacterium]